MNFFNHPWRRAVLLAVIAQWLLLLPTVHAQDAETNAPESRLIRFNMSDGGGFPPFTYYDEHNQPQGIMYEVLATVASRRNYQLKLMALPRKRVDSMVAAGDVEVVPLAREWTKAPAKFLWSKPVIPHRDVIFSLRDRNLQFKKVEELIGMTLVVRFGYHYPLLDPYFEEGLIERQEDYSESIMLTHLLKTPDRVDGAVINEMVGLWLIKEKRLGNKFVLSEQDVSTVWYRFAVTPQRKQLLADIDAVLQDLKESGELQEIIARYQP
ncbi:transporter substrate-binding domain-containing protein [Hahella aquimaris]|uniref:substrate-binding periplasmic protein n=1 Tax=Hahella sp. HNIBRBA332 TaxID=3015983 RepID=UPI00273AE0F8|nr:transporter substrate-binding domain-containing protein [Hahella sp. HNIBRBA332]WLQ14498.1 transporter substrate-binding domain-containing protein [Hahella sp. HNIBRBA332]